MAIVANVVDIRGKLYEPLIEEILFENKTIKEELVAFETDVKAETIFTENSNAVTMQAYTSGAPTAAGTIGLFDAVVTPAKVMYYDEFDMNALRSSRFKRDMKAGAANVGSTEFEQKVLGNYGKLISFDAEVKFWCSITAATKAAIAALAAGTVQTSVGAAEQTWAAAQPAGLFDGVIAKMIYNNSNTTGAGALGARVKVLGTTITSANIATEYAKFYAAIPAVVLNNPSTVPYIYAPYSHKQLINIYNSAATYRDLFSVSEDRSKYFYNGVEIKFVPVPENCVVTAWSQNIVWCTDLVNDINVMEINKKANNQDVQFLKNVFTLTSHIANQKANVLYLG